MATLTLLEMVQDILNDMDSTPVDSINGSTESEQVVQIIKTQYREILARKDWEFMKQQRQLEAVADASKPTKLKIPEDVSRITCLRYESTKINETPRTWVDLDYMHPCDFIDFVQSRSSDEDNIVETTNDTGVTLLIRNDSEPKFWTSFDNTFLYMDSFDSTTDSTLQQSKTVVRAVVEPGFDTTDTGGPIGFPANMYSLLLNQSKAAAFRALKQTSNADADLIARRQYAKLQLLEDRTRGEPEFANYGRKARARKASSRFGINRLGGYKCWW